MASMLHANCFRESSANTLTGDKAFLLLSVLGQRTNCWNALDGGNGLGMMVSVRGLRVCLLSFAGTNGWAAQERHPSQSDMFHGRGRC
jgi:hypothetical protein